MRIVALHGAFGRGSIFDRLARDTGLPIEAPDLRGHGHNPDRGRYTRSAFIEDVVRYIDGDSVVLLGHSLGGITAYQVAARHPELVRGLIIEDVGPVMRQPEVASPVLDVAGFPRSAPSREALRAALEAVGIPDATYFMHSAVQRGDRWEFLFDWDDMVAVQESGVGDWRADWFGSSCPALLLRGGRSPLFPEALAREAAARPGTTLVTFADAGHWVHDDAPAEMAAAVLEFVTGLR